uniref:Uncharacterized protein n=1 Tax=Arundo donax TaxID=35708 RepID=A0A0A9AHN5_ARUDO
MHIFLGRFVMECLPFSLVLIYLLSTRCTSRPLPPCYENPVAQGQETSSLAYG